ncbi:MAG: oligosaccharide flippase family protein, partial [Candidatus Binatia bacterium]
MLQRPHPLGPRVAEALAWSSVGGPLRAGLAVLVSVVTARLLGPEAYGAYAILLSLLGTLIVYTDLGVGRSLLRFLPFAASRHGAAGVRTLLRDVLSAR